MQGTGLASIGWGHNLEKGVLRHVSHAVGALEVNSTIENATIPYFEVHSIQWITSSDEIPYIRDKGIFAALADNQDMAPVIVNSIPPGAPIPIPNTTITRWSNDPLELKSVRETILFMFPHAVRDFSNMSFSLTQDLPHGLYTANHDDLEIVFAWITYSAGVGRCTEYSCRVSAPSTIQNTTAIELEPHQLTYHSLLMSPVIACSLVNLNASLPSPWSNTEDYIEAVLVRAYSGAWSTPNSAMSTGDAQSDYIPTLPGLLAEVDRPRVFIWLGPHMLVTSLSILFIILQARLSNYPLIGDTTLAAFYLDTTGIPSPGGVSANQLDKSALLKVKLQDDRLKVILD